MADHVPDAKLALASPFRVELIGLGSPTFCFGTRPPSCAGGGLPRALGRGGKLTRHAPGQDDAARLDECRPRQMEHSILLEGPDGTLSPRHWARRREDGMPTAGRSAGLAVEHRDSLVATVDASSDTRRARPNKTTMHRRLVSAHRLTSSVPRRTPLPPLAPQ